MEATEHFDQEKRFLIGLITDTRLCQEALPHLDPDTLANHYSRDIVLMVKNYFDRTGQAPGIEIENIYHDSRGFLSTEKYENIGTILQHLSDFMDSGIKRVPEASLRDTQDFLNLSAIRKVSEKASYHAERGEISKALEAMNMFKEVKLGDTSSTNVVTDLRLQQESLIQEAYPEESEHNILKLNGRLGEYLGWWTGGNVILFLAPMKRGKTFCLSNCAIDSVLNMRNTLYVSLEMSDLDMAMRFRRAVTGMNTDPKIKKPYRKLEGKNVPVKMIPIFDCLKNQAGTCQLKQRVRNNRAVGIIDHPDDTTKFPKHVPCIACRGTAEFTPRVWYKYVEDQSSVKNVQERMSMWQPQFDKFLRTVSFPAGEATVHSIMSKVSALQHKENFNVEVLIIDYADLLKAKNTRVDYRHQLNEIGTDLKGFSTTNNALVITASQTNRSGLGARDIKNDMVAENIGKIAGSTQVIAMNSSVKMKQLGLMELAITDDRFGAGIERCIILQDLARGQFALDAEITREKLDFK